MNQKFKEITEYLVQQKGWTKEQAEEIGPQCQWNRSLMEKAYADLCLDKQNLKVSQNSLLQNDFQVQNYNQWELDENEQYEQALKASQYQQDTQPASKRKKYDDYPVGMQNLGNTCYLNCLIQLLFYNPKLVEQILQYKIPESSQSGEILQISKKFIIELQVVFSNQIMSNQKYFKPSQFNDAAKNLEKKVKNIIQQNNDFMDVSEYFAVLMELIDLSLNKQFIKQHNKLTIFQNEQLEKQYIIKSEEQHQFLWEMGIKNYQIYNFLNKEIIENQRKIKELPENLVFSLERNIQKNNRKIEKTEEKFYFPNNLHLDFILGDIQASQKVEKYIKEQLKTLEVYQQLNKQTEAFEKVLIYYESLPMFDAFILRNLKFEYQKKVEELNKQFPLNYEFLNQELQNTSKNLYQLAQIVVHTGSILHGHYYLYQYNFYLKKWFKYNDTEVVIQTEQEVMADSIKNGNILIYLSQEQKREVYSYQKELNEIDKIRDQLKPNNNVNNLLKKIPKEIYENILKENEQFLNKYGEEIKDC